MTTKKQGKTLPDGLRKKRKFDSLYCVGALLIFGIVCCVDFLKWDIPSWLITRLDIVDSSYVLLQIQVTVAVLPLAIIALITGMSKDIIYGMSIT